jgi:DNA-binding NtrC family response regulator/tetratricopeptide (TPR) repeat protein
MWANWGRYQRLAEAASGPGRVVVRCADQLTGSVSVLKYAEVGSEAASALRDEADLLVGLGHPELVHLVDRFTEVSGPEGARVTGFATGWVDGEPLVRAASRLPIDARVAAFGGIMRAVDYLHRRGLLHLDLKPANTVATDGGSVLLDLGSARPVDAGPGEAGGTFGYAAPEVVNGLAATVASDVYGLGAVLYEVLSGVPADLNPGRSGRRAYVPVRARVAEVPRALGAVVDDMLAVEPGARPGTVREVAERLGQAGVPIVLDTSGTPPMVGREALIDTMVAMAQQPGYPLVLVGPTGSGRARLARQVLLGSAAPGHAGADLSGARDLERALLELLALPSDALGHLVFLGDVERLGAGGRERVLALLREGAAARMRFIWSATRPIPNTIPFAIGPLMNDADIVRLAAFHRVGPSPALTEARARGGGYPGPLQEALVGTFSIPIGLSPADTELLEALATLPDLVPAPVVSLLDRKLNGSVLRLLGVGALRQTAEGALRLPDPRRTNVHPWLSPLCDALLERAREPDAVWAALLAARSDRLDVAATLLGVAVERGAQRRSDLEELCERLAAAGHTDARWHRVRMALDAGALKDVVAWGSNADDPRAAPLVVRALRQLDQPDEAITFGASAQARGLPSDAHARVLVECAFATLALAHYDDVEPLCARALELDPALTWEILGVRLVLVVARIDRGADASEALPLMEAVRPLIAAGSGAEGWVRAQVPVPVLSGLARILGRIDRVAEALEVSKGAVMMADHAGDLVRAASLRLNLGNLEMRAAHSDRARAAFEEALLVARAFDRPALRVRVVYGLAELELRSGRTASAAQYVAELEEMTRGTTEPDVAARVALLSGWCAVERGAHQAALDALSAIPADAPDEMLAARAFLLAEAHLQLGHARLAHDVLEGAPAPKAPIARARLVSLRARAHFAMGRDLLAVALKELPDEVGRLDRVDVGRVLLACGGEGAEPHTFGARKEYLDRAASLLHGEDAGRAADLRDRMLATPGATLDLVAELVESLDDPRAFPRAVARLVRGALGANRVLILVRLPGLGNQRGFEDLSRAEVAGISDEVLRRIQRPGDVWYAEDAVADPKIIAVSRTVATFRIRSLVAVAIPYDGKAIGALYVDDLQRRGRFGDNDVSLLQRLAATIGRVVGGRIAVRGGGVERLDPVDLYGLLLCDSGRVRAVRETLEAARALNQANLLLTGQSGAGKTEFARRIAKEVFGLRGLHEVRLTRYPVERLVGLLHGTAPGDFTGAERRAGVVKEAIVERKALFLDEVHALDADAQQALLPLLELPNRRAASLGGASAPLGAPLTVILATNADVRGSEWQSAFRPDFWYRVRGSWIELPPLNERGRQAVYMYLRAMLTERGAPAPEEVFDTDALDLVTSAAWEGNLRDLRDVAHQMATLFASRGKPVTRRDLEERGPAPQVALHSSAESLDEIEREAVVRALEAVSYNQSRAARRLGISRWALLRMLRAYGILDRVRELRGRARRDGAPADDDDADDA